MLRRRAGARGARSAARACRHHVAQQPHSGPVWWRCPDGTSDSQNALALGLDISTRATGYCVLDARGTYPVPCTSLIASFRSVAVPDAPSLPPCSRIADGRILEWGCIETLSLLDRYDRTTAMAEELRALCLRHNTSHWLIGAEDYAKRWTGGRSNLFALAEANIATTLVCHQVFGSRPIPVHPNTARSQVGVPTAAAAAKLSATGCELDSGNASDPCATAPCALHPPLNVKDRVLGFVSQHMPAGFEWPLQTTALRRRAPDSSAVMSDVAAPHPCCYDVADAYVIARYVALHAENCRLLEENAQLLTDRQAAYRASKRYTSNLKKARKARGAAAARRYDASVSKRIERKLLSDLRAGTAP